MSNVCPVLLHTGAVKTKQDTWEGIMWVMTQGHKKYPTKIRQATGPQNAGLS